MCSVGYKSVLPNRNRQMTYMHRGNCRSSVCRSKGGRPVVVVVVMVVVVAGEVGGPKLSQLPGDQVSNHQGTQLWTNMYVHSALHSHY